MDAVEHSEGPSSLSSKDGLEQMILRLLQQDFQPKTALQISKDVGLKTAKEVNPTLYALEKKKLVHKVQMNKKVQWIAVDTDFQMMPAIVDIKDEINENDNAAAGTIMQRKTTPVKHQVFSPEKESNATSHADYGKRHRDDSSGSNTSHIINTADGGNDQEIDQDSPMPTQCLDDDKVSEPPSKSHLSEFQAMKINAATNSLDVAGRGQMLSNFVHQSSQGSGRGNGRPNTFGPGNLPNTLPKSPHELLQGLAGQRNIQTAGTDNSPNQPQSYPHSREESSYNSGSFNQRSFPGSQNTGYGRNNQRSSYEGVSSQSGYHSNISQFSSTTESYSRNPAMENNQQHSYEQYGQQASQSIRPLMGDYNEGYNLGNEDEKTVAKVKDFLGMFKRPVATLEIAKAVSKGRKKEINPILYDMQKRGMIIKATNQPPSWKLPECLGLKQNPLQSQSTSSRQAPNQPASMNPPRFSQSPRQTSWPPGDVIEANTEFENRASPQQYIGTDRSLLQQPHPTPSIPQPPCSLLSRGAQSSYSTPAPHQIKSPQSFLSSGSKSTHPIQSPPQYASKPQSMFAGGSEISPQSRNLGIIQHQSGTPAELSGITFAALNKNPISAINEYAQKNQMELSFELLHEAKGGKNKFLVAVKMNGKMYNAVSAANMKDARREAADVALRDVLSKQAASALQGSSRVASSAALTHFDKIALLSHQAFINISADVQEKFAGKKVIAAIIMKSYEDTTGKAVSIGTGNRCVTGDRLNPDGKTVYDSHAEIICRRAFLRYLYSQVESFYCSKESIFEEGGMNGKLQLKDGITFHLYISTAPCGDGALFSPRDMATEEPSALANSSREHFPVFSSKQQGLLRTKIEDGEGTIPIDPNDGPQTWDGIVMGKRLRTMSCTDKVCRWNILGLQGALLSHLIDPIYLDSITLGYLYDHGHLSRAVCCRLNKHSLVDPDLPMPFYLNHPWLGRVTAYDPPRETEKTNNLSINWYLGCDKVEITDGRTGSCLTRTNNAPTPSRLCKAEQYYNFKYVCFNVAALNHFAHFETYREAKENATAFQGAKNAMNKQFTISKFGTWVKKPRELEMFDVNIE